MLRLGDVLVLAGGADQGVLAAHDAKSAHQTA